MKISKVLNSWWERKGDRSSELDKHSQLQTGGGATLEKCNPEVFDVKYCSCHILVG